jgi:Ca2+-binding RTX toxin-like protein
MELCRPDCVERVVGTESHDELTGGRGSDWILGGDDWDWIIGGGGQDRLVGENGDDRIDSVDRSVDSVSCGPGHDWVRADPKDILRAGCEEVTRIEVRRG